MNFNGFDDQFLDLLKSKNDIVNTISKYVTLQKKGNNFWACCPFHSEKTPSFSIKEDGQYYHCFGCGETGDVIKFVQKYENVDFVTATKILAKSAGLEIPTAQLTDEQKRKKERRDKCYEILEATCKFYQNNLKTTKNTDYIDYIKVRRLTETSLSTFRIGVSLDFSSLIRYLKSKGFTEEDIIESGVGGKNEHGLYDFYGERVIFPIMNSFGDVIGFSARTIDKDSKFAKYKNTPQTFIFTKGQTLYGINNARELKRNRELDFIILVEGQMDVIACFDAGFKNAIGSMGTALTIQHAEDIYKLCDNVIICMDQDKAGRDATIKAIDTLRKKGLNIKVAVFSEAKDPDEYIRKFGSKSFGDMLAMSKPAFDFVLDNIASTFDLTDNVQRSKCIKEMLEFVATMSTNSEREVYLDYVKKITKVPIEVLRSDLSTQPKEQSSAEDILASEKQIGIDTKQKEACIYLLAYALSGGKNVVLKSEPLGELLSGDLLGLYNAIVSKQSAGESLVVSQVFNMFDVQPNSDIDKVINYSFNMSESAQQKYYEDCLRTIEKSYYTRLKNILTQQLTSAKDSKDMESLFIKIEEINKKIK